MPERQTLARARQDAREGKAPSTQALEPRQVAASKTGRTHTSRESDVNRRFQTDDLKTDPAGNAGDRIACGLIIK
jgi:hypothetical protein